MDYEGRIQEKGSLAMGVRVTEEEGEMDYAQELARRQLEEMEARGERKRRRGGVAGFMLVALGIVWLFASGGEAGKGWMVVLGVVCMASGWVKMLRS